MAPRIRETNSSVAVKIETRRTVSHYNILYSTYETKNLTTFIVFWHRKFFNVFVFPSLPSPLTLTPIAYSFSRQSTANPSTLPLNLNSTFFHPRPSAVLSKYFSRKSPLYCFCSLFSTSAYDQALPYLRQQTIFY